MYWDVPGLGAVTSFFQEDVRIGAIGQGWTGIGGDRVDGENIVGF